MRDGYGVNRMCRFGSIHGLGQVLDGLNFGSTAAADGHVAVRPGVGGKPTTTAAAAINMATRASSACMHARRARVLRNERRDAPAVRDGCRRLVPAHLPLGRAVEHARIRRDGRDRIKLRPHCGCSKEPNERRDTCESSNGLEFWLQVMGAISNERRPSDVLPSSRSRAWARK